MSDIFAHAWSLLVGERYGLFARLFIHFDGFENAWNNFESESYHTLNMTPENFYYIKSIKEKINPEEEYQVLTSQKISFLTINDSDYPNLLKQIPQPPLVLYYRGDLEVLNKVCIGVVGTRKNTAYGENCTRKIVKELVEQEVIIVSGFARGIDSLAHQFAIDYKGLTVAVMAQGLSTLYPTGNRYLADKILDTGGLLLTEFSPKVHCQKHFFLRRNRIISGLSRGICVVECPDKSGAINTAQHAFDQNRNVYVVPGDIYRENSEGPLKLMQKDKAYPIKDAISMLVDLNLPVLDQASLVKSNLSAEEKRVLKMIDYGHHTSLQEIYDKTKTPFKLLNSILIKLEFDGQIVKNARGYLRVLS